MAQLTVHETKDEEVKTPVVKDNQVKDSKAG